MYQYLKKFEDSLRDSLVLGIRDTALQMTLLAEGDKLTFPRAYQLSLAKEAALADSSAIRQDHDVNAQVFRTDAVNKGNKPRCMRCGSNSHSSSQCSHINSVCSACGKFGHLQRICQTSKFKKNVKS